MTEIVIRQVDDFQFQRDVQEVAAIELELRDSANWEMENGDESKSERLANVADALMRMREVYLDAQRLGVVLLRTTDRDFELSRWG